MNEDQPSRLARHVRVKTGADGRLTLVAIRPAGDGLSSAWVSMTTSRRRDVVFHNGELIHDGSEDPVDQTVAFALSTIEAAEIERAEERPAIKPRRRLSVGGMADDSLKRMLAQIVGETSDDPATVRFVRVCGISTLRLAFAGRATEPLLVLDGACGFEAVEAFFAKWPFLLYSTATRIGLTSGTRMHEPLWAAIKAQEGDVLDHAADAILGSREGWSEDDATRQRTALRHLLRRLRGVETGGPVDAFAMTWLAGQVPPDWLPETSADAVLFSRAAIVINDVAKASAGELSGRVLAASSKGRWGDFLDRIGASRPTEREHLRSAIVDMVKAFRNQVAAPAVRHHLTFEGRDARGDERLRMALPKAMRVSETDAFRRLDRVCWRLLFANKSLPAIVEAQAIWHRDREAMDRAIGIGDNVSWAVPFGRVHVDGITLVPVEDSFTLQHEGAALRHCVGGYVDRCMERTSVIVSVRHRSDNGNEIVETRSSTVELSGWDPGEPWTPMIVQHKGLLNSAPPDEDVAAVVKFVDDWIGAKRKADGEPLPAAEKRKARELRDEDDDLFPLDFMEPPERQFDPLVVDPPYGVFRQADRPVPPAGNGVVGPPHGGNTWVPAGPPPGFDGVVGRRRAIPPRPLDRAGIAAARAVGVIDAAAARLAIRAGMNVGDMDPAVFDRAAAIARHERRLGREARRVLALDLETTGLEEAGLRAERDMVSVAAGYDWMDAGRIDNAFAQWRRFLPSEIGTRGTVWFRDHLDEIAGEATDLARLREGVAMAHAGDAPAVGDQAANSGAGREILSPANSPDPDNDTIMPDRPKPQRGFHPLAIAVAAEFLLACVMARGGGLSGFASAMIGFSLVASATVLLGLPRSKPASGEAS